MRALTYQSRRAQFDLLAVVSGLVLAALGLVIQWIVRPSTFASFGFPPGLIYVVGTTAIVWFSRRSPWAGAGGATMGAWILIGGLVGGELQTNLGGGDAGVVVGNVVMAVGLGVALAAGIVSIAVARRTRPRHEFRPISAENPRRVAAIAAICGLLIDSIGDAAPEGFRWDGLGPLLFVVLAVATAMTPGPVMMRMSVLICFSFIGGAFSSPEFTGPLSRPALDLDFIGASLQLGGLLIAFLAGLFASIPARNRRAESAETDPGHQTSNT